jgi:hypothetical protein
LKLALGTYLSKSFSVNALIEGSKKMAFLFRTLGGWKQFDCVFVVYTQQGILLVNPQRKDHWEILEKIPAGTLVTVYLQTTQGKRSKAQEALALDRIQSVFELVQVRNDLHDQLPTPVIQMKNPPRPSPSPAKPKSHLPSRSSQFNRGSQKLAMSFRVVINKMDTFVHAGNAQLIVSHLAEYPGRVELYVLRPEKKKIQLDADSIWSAEIRNGETVYYEFFGPQPTEEFVKALASKTNKYTQMDKIANE